MRATVVRPEDLGVSEAATWAQFQRRHQSTLNPFLSLTFARVVGRHRPGARVAVLEDHGSIVAFFAHEVMAGQRARPIGWPMNDLQGVLSSGAPLDLRTVLTQSGLRSWWFDHLMEEQAVGAGMRQAIFRSPVMDLSGGNDAYRQALADRKTKALSQLARKQRSLARELGPVTLEWQSTRQTDLSQVIRWKVDQYERTGGTNLFADPRALAIATDLAATNCTDCTGVVNVLRAGDRTVAAHLGLVGPGGLSWYFPTYDPAVARFSPGQILLLELAGEAAKRGLAQIDLGAGEQPYKVRMATGSYEVARGSLYVWRLEGVLRRLYRSIHRAPGR